MCKNQSVIPFTLYNEYILLIVFLFIFQSTMYTKSACIIIHGTWANNEKWYKQGGDFFEAVKKCNEEIKVVDEIVSFGWSGKLGHLAHIEAAKKLTTILLEYDWVFLIAHSHGVTVGMLGAQMLFENFSNRKILGKIKKFYALGVPVRESTVSPNSYVIERFYNLFSFGDMIQMVNGTAERCFCKQNHIVNISIKIQDKHPNHTALHHPAVGKDLLKIEEHFGQYDVGNFKKFSFHHPALISFYIYGHPEYEEQFDQEKFLQIDREAFEITTKVFFRNRKE